MPRATAPPTDDAASHPSEAGRLPVTGLARRAHWLLAIAFLPLALFLLAGPSLDDQRERVLRTFDEAAERGIDLPLADSDSDEFLRAAPDQRIHGAHLGRDSVLHWIYGLMAGAAALWLAAALPRGNSEPRQLVKVAAFTATVGIALLLVFQVFAAWTQGLIVSGRGILTLVFWVVKLIGYSYSAALDPENGFVASLVGFTLGVGLCEELCKALPLIWHYRSRATLDWRGACAWGLASGIGFGIAEAILYSGQHYNGVETVGIYAVRFVSCVALHAVWTAGVALVIAREPTRVQGGEEWWSGVLSLLFVLATPMTLHGLYDTLLKRDHYVLALVVALASLGWLVWLIERGGAEVSSAPARASRPRQRLGAWRGAV